MKKLYKCPTCYKMFAWRVCMHNEICESCNKGVHCTKRLFTDGKTTTVVCKCENAKHFASYVGEK